MGSRAENRPGKGGLALRVAGILAVPAAIGFALDCGGGNDTTPSTPTAVQTETPGMPSATGLVESPTPSPEPTASTGFHANKDGSISYRTEKGEILNIPQIPGLKAELDTDQTTGVQKVVYKALPDNPYGLKEGTTSAVFYPEIYSITDNLETAKQTGGIGLRAEVIRNFLAQSGSPQNEILTPLPFDLTTAKDKKVLIQPSTNTKTNQPALFLKIPIGTKFVVPIEAKENRPLTVREAQQSGGYTTIAIGFDPALFLETYALNMYYAKGVETKDTQKNLGDEFLTVDADSFSTELLGFYRENRNPPPLGGPNIALGLQAFFTDRSGNIPHTGFGVNNILSIDKIPTFVISNDNPLISSK